MREAYLWFLGIVATIAIVALVTNNVRTYHRPGGPRVSLVAPKPAATPAQEIKHPTPAELLQTPKAKPQPTVDQEIASDEKEEVAEEAAELDVQREIARDKDVDPSSKAYPLYPDPALTPGDTLNVTEADVCVPGYAKRTRNVSAAMKSLVYNEYRVPHRPGAHEIDHLLSLELGGSNDIKNLWPQPYKAPGGYGAREKDKAECWLHDQICAGKMTLKEAQQKILADWIAVYNECCAADKKPLPSVVE